MQRQQNAFELREATTEAELEAIYRFRYKVYVEEMGRDQDTADHANKRIIDALDKEGCNVAAWDKSTILGIVRYNHFTDPATTYYQKLYDLSSDDSFVQNASILVTRLMISKEYRGTELAQCLAVEIYRRSVLSDIRYGYIDCNDYLLPWFKKLGFVVHGQTKHPSYGFVYLLRVDVHNGAYFKSLDSPFFSILERYGTDSISVCSE